MHYRLARFLIDQLAQLNSLDSLAQVYFCISYAKNAFAVVPVGSIRIKGLLKQ